MPEAGAVGVPEDLDLAEVVSLLFLHDRLPGAAPHGAGEARGVGARPARPAGWASRRSSWERWPGSPVRDVFGARPCCGRAAGCGRHRLSQRELPRAGSRTPWERGGRRARLAWWPDLASLLPRATARRQARRVRPLRHALARAQGPAGGDRVVRGARDRLALGQGVAPPEGFAYHIQKFRDAPRRPGAAGGEPLDPEWFREDFAVLVELLRADKIHPVVAECLSLTEVVTRTNCWRARHRRECWCWCHKPTRTRGDGARRPRSSSTGADPMKFGARRRRATCSSPSTALATCRSRLTPVATDRADGGMSGRSARRLSDAEPHISRGGMTRRQRGFGGPIRRLFHLGSRDRGTCKPSVIAG